MPRVITSEDIRRARKAGQQAIGIALGTLVTPQARDDARAYGIELSTAVEHAPERRFADRSEQAGQRAAGEREVEEAVRRLALRLAVFPRPPAESVTAVPTAALAAAPTAATGESNMEKLASVIKEVITELYPQAGTAGAQALPGRVRVSESSSGGRLFSLLSWDGAPLEWDFEEAESLFAVQGKIRVDSNGEVFELAPGQGREIRAQSHVVLSASGPCSCKLVGNAAANLK